MFPASRKDFLKTLAVFLKIISSFDLFNIIKIMKTWIYNMINVASFEISKTVPVRT